MFIVPPTSEDRAPRYADSIEQISSIAVTVISPFSGDCAFCEPMARISFRMLSNDNDDRESASAPSAPIASICSLASSDRLS